MLQAMGRLGALPHPCYGVVCFSVLGALGCSSATAPTRSVEGRASSLTWSTSEQLGAQANDEGGVSFGLDQFSRARRSVGLSSWSAVTGLPTALRGHAAVHTPGFVYVLGGCSALSAGTCTQRAQQVQFTPIAADGSLGPWSATTPLPSALEDHQAVSYNGFLFVSGGIDANATPHDEVWAATQNPDGTLGAWAVVGRFARARRSHAMVAYANNLYILGGQSAQLEADVQVAPIRADGTLGPFVATQSLPSARQKCAAVAIADGLYVFGGDSAGATAQVSWAPIEPDGSLVGWSATSPLPQPLFGFALTAWAGSVYVIGGLDASAAPSQNVFVASVLAARGVGAWRVTTAMPSARDGLASLALGARVYIFGGATGAPAAPSAQVLSAPIDGSVSQRGDLSSWSALPALSTPRQHPSATVYNNKLYVTGGCDVGAQNQSCTSRLTEVQIGDIAADGSVTGWAKSPNQFAGPRDIHSTLAHNGWLYVIGGQSNSGYYADVQMAPIQADGSIGAFVTSPVVLPAARGSQSALIDNNRIYLAGGVTPSYTNTVLSALLNADGSLGTFITAGTFTQARIHAASAVRGRKFYVVGGWSGGGLGDVQSAPILADGSLGTFQSVGALTAANSSFSGFSALGRYYVCGGFANSVIVADAVNSAFAADGSTGTFVDTGAALPAPRFRHATAVGNGHVYAIAGRDTANMVATGEFATIETPVAQAAYSKRIDLGAEQTVTALTIYGAGGAADVLRVAYRTAGADAVWRPLIDAGPIAFGAPQPLNLSNVRYVWLHITLSGANGLDLDANDSSPATVTEVQLEVPAPAIDAGLLETDAGTSTNDNVAPRRRLVLNVGCGCEGAASPTACAVLPLMLWRARRRVTRTVARLR